MRISERQYKKIRRTADRISDYCFKLAYPARGSHFPPILINALPKSGSTYISRSLGRALQVGPLSIANHGLVSTGIVNVDVLERVAAGNCVLHQHLPAEPHIVLALAAKCPRMVLNLRDPRAALVSWSYFVREFNEQHSYIFALQAVEQSLPERFFEWPDKEQLSWHVDHSLPAMIAWITRWLEVVDAGPQGSGLTILVTEYTELVEKPEVLFRRILDFFGVDIEPGWLSIRQPKPGSWKFRAGTTKDWRADYAPADLARATEMLPQGWGDRFGWA